MRTDDECTCLCAATSSIVREKEREPSFHVVSRFGGALSRARLPSAPQITTRSFRYLRVYFSLFLTYIHTPHRARMSHLLETHETCIMVLSFVTLSTLEDPHPSSLQKRQAENALFLCGDKGVVQIVLAWSSRGDGRLCGDKGVV